MSAQDARREPRLRYFACRSRGQALRFAFASAGQPFHDERVPVGELAAFRARKSDPEVAGPFGGLPVLYWEREVVAETLAIAAYLAERFGESSGTSTAERARRAMLISVAHLEMQTPYSSLMWLPADVDDQRLVDTARDLLRHLRRTAALVERALDEGPGSGPLIGGARPCVADAFLFESLERGAAVFGAAFGESLGGRLRSLRDEFEGWPGVAAARADAPPVVTASPAEPALRGRLSDLELAAP